MAKSAKGGNLGLASLFVFLVFGLIFLSFLVKVIFFIKDTKFDGKHEFNIEVLSKNSTQVISLSPPTRSISILTLDNKETNLEKELEVPIDSAVFSSKPISKDNLSNFFLKSILPFENSFKNMNYIDALRVFLYSRNVLASSVYNRQISNMLNDQQAATITSLTFTDPTIYQENKSIEVINATDSVGLGNRIANMIANIGGNVILVTSAQSTSKKSEIIYFGDGGYTVERLSKILNFPLNKTNKQSIADVIIVIGEDERINF